MGGGGGRERATGGSMQQSSAREVGREAANEWARDAYRDQRTKICLHFHTETNDGRASAFISSVVPNGFISFCLTRHVFDQKYVKGRKKNVCLIKRTISIQCVRVLLSSTQRQQEESDLRESWTHKLQRPRKQTAD